MTKTITERLEIVINELGENVNSFAGKIGVSRSTIAMAIERNRGVNSDLLQKITDTFATINIDWLVTGRGDKFINAGRDNNIIGGDNSGVIGNSGTVSNVGGHNVSIAGDTKAKKIIDKDRIEIELEQSVELYQQKIASLEIRIKDLEARLRDKDEIIDMLKNK